MKYSKFIVALIIMLNSLAFAAIIYVFKQVGSEPTALIAAWFGFTTGELWLLANIKKTEVKTGGTKYGQDQLETEADES